MNAFCTHNTAELVIDVHRLHYINVHGLSQTFSVYAGKRLSQLTCEGYGQCQENVDSSGANKDCHRRELLLEKPTYLVVHSYKA